MQIEIDDIVLIIPVKIQCRKDSIIGRIRKCQLPKDEPCIYCNHNGTDILSYDGKVYCIEKVVRKATKEEIAQFTLESLIHGHAQNQ